MAMFKVGDKVQLNSGGPIMTVEILGPSKTPITGFPINEGNVSVVWADGHASSGVWTIHHDQFDEKTLKIVK
jgi:uncharacterized protein YodC (DUF2158 family)